MEEIIKKARSLARELPFEGIEELSFELGAEIYEILEGENIQEVYFPELKAIALKRGLHPYLKRYLIAHALGHHLFHQKGLQRNYLLLHERGFLGSLEQGRIEIERREREADLFASHLLIPEEKLNSLLKEDWVKGAPFEEVISYLAEEFQVPPELVKIRLEFEKAEEKAS